MEFKTKPQEECYNKVIDWMKEIFGAFVRVDEDSPFFRVNYGSAMLIVNVYPWGDDEAVVCSRSYVVMDVEVTPELMRYLLRENDDMRFGAYGLDKDDDVYFEHAVVGSTCSKNELEASAMAVLRVADRYDDEIVSRWGGRRASD